MHLVVDDGDDDDGIAMMAKMMMVMMTMAMAIMLMAMMIMAMKKFLYTHFRQKNLEIAENARNFPKN